MTTYLFIGGPADGKRLSVNSERERIVLYRHNGSLAHTPDYGSNSAQIELVDHEYCRHSLREGNVCTDLFVSPEVDSVVARLIEGYVAKTPAVDARGITIRPLLWRG